MPRPERPNIIFILADQLRYDFLSCNGARFINTPHIDSLCERGVRFTRAYSEHPVCVPARASLMTGQHALTTGVLDNGQALRPDHRACGLDTWPELLAERGYYTAGIGKMHFYPWDARLGYQYRSICEDKRWIYLRDDYDHFLRARGERKHHGNEHAGYFENRGAVINLLPWELQWDYFVGQEACRFINERGAEAPFAMMVGFPGPHCPYDPDARFLERVDASALPEPMPDTGDTPGIREGLIRGNKLPWNGVDYSEFTAAHKRKIRLHYAALVAQIDEQVGAILAALRERGLAENTVIIFSADHGDYLGDHNLIGKGQFLESSWHVPLIASLPWAEGPAVCAELAALTDVTATLMSLAGQDVPAHWYARPLPGLGLAGGAGREHLLGALGGGWALCKDNWVYSVYNSGETLLYHQLDDPREEHNRADDPACRGVVCELDALLHREVMRRLRSAFHYQRVYTRDLSQTPEFGREGWQRPYPLPMGEGANG